MVRSNLRILALIIIVIVGGISLGAYFLIEAIQPAWHSQPPPLSFINATVDNATQMTIFVKNYGSPLEINNVTVNGIPQILTPHIVLETGQIQEFTVTGIGTNWTVGVGHEVWLCDSNSILQEVTVS